DFHVTGVQTCALPISHPFLFEKKKQQAAAKKNQKQIQIKEVKFRPGTDEGDYQVKLRNLMRFLSDGDKAKVSLRFRGREMAHQRSEERRVGKECSLSE